MQPAATKPRFIKKPALGYAAACAVVLIWSTWLVASRYGVQTALTIFDLAALRYGVSAIVALPIVLYYKPWRTISVWQIVVITFLLSPIYALFVFGAFNYAPAAHGAIFMNAALPSITLLIGWYWLVETIHPKQLVGTALIFTGAILAVADASQLSLTNSWLGDLMFFVGALFFAAYLVVSRVWNIGLTHLLLCSSLINALLYIPVWFLFLPSGFAETSQPQIALQFLYQGLIPNLLGLLLVTIAVRHIGSSPTAAFMAAVPGMGTILSLLFLGEAPGLLGWISLIILTPGILMVALAKPN